MILKTIFETCKPRGDVLAGLRDADFAADLARVANRTAPAEYLDPGRFFAGTFPTRGLRELLDSVSRRLSATGGEAAAIFRLDTSYGGGKTHGLIALAHVARGVGEISGIEDFVDPALLPPSPVRLAVFDGENADPAVGTDAGAGVRVKTPWGAIAWELGGEDGYERVRENDERIVAPGAGILAELLGDAPALLLLDELSIWLRKANRLGDAGGQLAPFLTALFKAVDGASGAALVHTLAIGKGGEAVDAYSEENRFLAERMDEIGKVSARKATLLNPTEDDETALVLRRRLFASVDEGAARTAADAYRELWRAAGDRLSPDAGRAETAEALRDGYPFHPELLDTLTSKTATLETFQRVRGMLRLLGRTVARLWKQRPKDATAIHLHHVDLGHEPIRNEVLTRLGQQALRPALENDVHGSPAKPSLAQEMDRERHEGLPPYAGYLARAVFCHSLAFNEPLKGVSPEGLRFSLLAPGLDLGFIEEARRAFHAESAYLDDRPSAPLRFLAEPNLTQILRREEARVDPGEARAELNAAIRTAFSGATFDSVCFPGGPADVADDVGTGKPKLVVLAYDAETVEPPAEIPRLVARLYQHKGSDGSALRELRNHLLFVVAEEGGRGEMRRRAARRLALQSLCRQDVLDDLAEHQREKVRGWEKTSLAELAIAICQAYRHLFYPSRHRAVGAPVDLAHFALDLPSASERPGTGQTHLARALRELNKLRTPEDNPDSPAYVRSRTPLGKRGQMTTGALRAEFRRDPGLPMLVGEDAFVRGLREGVEQGEYVYQREELLCGKGDPPAQIVVDEQSFILTAEYARRKKIWPRPEPGNGGAEHPESEGGGADGGVEDDGGQGRPFGLDDAEDLHTDGPLREALTKLFETARGRHLDVLETLEVRLFEAADGFRVLAAAGAVRQTSRKDAEIKAECETREAGELEVRFRGPVAEAVPVREFLEPLLREASTRDVEIALEIGFDPGLPVSGEAPGALTKQLARFAPSRAAVKGVARRRST
ncbi:MAG: DUF499 domain-containing protein [Acidobacteriota bacterium]|nr:DUF499 domain-containing protein [Acidobacteriota bacterium]